MENPTLFRTILRKLPLYIILHLKFKLMKKLYSTILSFSILISAVNVSLAKAPASTNNGIQFKKLNYNEALQLAKKENKNVALYVYTVWCPPCKMMQNKTFKENKVGDYFNNHFVTIQVEAEQDTDGSMVMRKYGLRAHPVILILKPNGELVKEVLGYYTGSDLLSQVKGL